jgi:NADPH-dependent curcumin reductase CurA
MSTGNLQVRLAARPVGLPDDSTWQIEESGLPEPEDGELRVALNYLSLDPAMRGWLNDVKSYAPPVRLGAVMRAAGVGQVTASRHPDFQEGDLVHGMFGAQEHAISDGRGVSKVDPSIAPLPTWLGVLGATGLTAYFGMFDVAHIKAGDHVLVSGAAGAVGSVAGQIAKLTGCHAVGIAGGKDKCDWITRDLGFDAAIDYKNENVGERVHALMPDGIDVYFDNVGGPTLDTALAFLRLHARVVICGAISQYNSTGQLYAPTRYLSLLINRASMTGMLIFDYADRYAEAIAQLATWLQEGKLVAREQVVTGGVRKFPDALLMLFAGANTGKLVLEVLQRQEPRRPLLQVAGDALRGVGTLERLEHQLVRSRDRGGQVGVHRAENLFLDDAHRGRRARCRQVGRVGDRVRNQRWSRYHPVRQAHRERLVAENHPAG